MRHTIETDVSIELQDGTVRMYSAAQGELRVVGPRVSGIGDDNDFSDAHIHINIGHGSEPIEYEDGTTSEPGDWGSAGLFIDREKAAELGQALLEMANAEAEKMFETSEEE